MDFLLFFSLFFRKEKIWTNHKCIMCVIIIPIYKLTNTENLKNLQKTTIGFYFEQETFFFCSKKNRNSWFLILSVSVSMMVFNVCWNDAINISGLSFFKDIPVFFPVRRLKIINAEKSSSIKNSMFFEWWFTIGDDDNRQLLPPPLP